MVTIRLGVSGAELFIIDKVTVATEAVDTVAVSVEFSSDWDGYSKAIVFHREDESPIEVPLLAGSATVPNSLLTEDEIFMIGARGYLDDRVKTTCLVRYKPVLGAALGANVSPTAPANVYSQLLSAINLANTRIQGVILPEGSTTSDAEVADIRTGYNGDTYPTAGDAVREQLRALAQVVNTLNDGGLDIKDNLINSKINTWLSANPAQLDRVVESCAKTHKLGSYFCDFVYGASTEPPTGNRYLSGGCVDKNDDYMYDCISFNDNLTQSQIIRRNYKQGTIYKNATVEGRDNQCCIHPSTNKVVILDGRDSVNSLYIKDKTTFDAVSTKSTGNTHYKAIGLNSAGDGLALFGLSADGKTLFYSNVNSSYTIGSAVNCIALDFAIELQSATFANGFIVVLTKNNYVILYDASTKKPVRGCDIDVYADDLFNVGAVRQISWRSDVGLMFGVGSQYQGTFTVDDVETQIGGWLAMDFTLGIFKNMLYNPKHAVPDIKNRKANIYASECTSLGYLNDGSVEAPIALTEAMNGDITQYETFLNYNVNVMYCKNDMNIAPVGNPQIDLLIVEKCKVRFTGKVTINRLIIKTSGELRVGAGGVINNITASDSIITCNGTINNLTATRCVIDAKTYTGSMSLTDSHITGNILDTHIKQAAKDGIVEVKTSHAVYFVKGGSGVYLPAYRSGNGWKNSYLQYTDGSYMEYWDDQPATFADIDYIMAK